MRSPLRRLVLIVALVVVFVAAGVWLLGGGQQRARTTPEQAAAAALSGLHLSVNVAQPKLAVTSAIMDSLAEGIRTVRVRIVDELQITLRLESQHPVTFVGAPRICLVGPHAAPDDAGLSDRCWGEPDLAAILAAAMPADQAGRTHLQPGAPVSLTTTLRRGSTRCDYPVGNWEVELAVNPIIDAATAGERYLPTVSLPVPFVATDVWPELSSSTTRYCGLADAAYSEQGDPPLPRASPSPAP